ncbi:MAG: Peptidase M50B-like, partial [Planctomycetota bacterium]
VRFLIGLVLGLTLLPACVWVAGRAVRAAPSPWPEDPLWLVAGVGIGILFAAMRPNWFLHTFLHECAHATACILLGVRIRSFSATAGKGGCVEYDAPGPVRNTLIAIAPYTLPLVAGPLLAIQHVAGERDWRPAVTLLCGWALVAHLHGLYHNIRLNFFGSDSDLAVTGRLLGMVLIACALVLLAALAVWVLWSSARIAPGWPV